MARANVTLMDLYLYEMERETGERVSTPRDAYAEAEEALGEAADQAVVVVEGLERLASRLREAADALAYLHREMADE